MSYGPQPLWLVEQQEREQQAADARRHSYDDHLLVFKTGVFMVMGGTFTMTLFWTIFS